MIERKIKKSRDVSIIIPPRHHVSAYREVFFCERAQLRRILCFQSRILCDQIAQCLSQCAPLGFHSASAFTPGAVLCHDFFLFLP